ncbi:glycosyltransferase [Subtercola sp. RTI3]|uniref:glycosyltransferase n=1 Tax=Subtercola sp. RTI3 TaxID=3048639 RepID=UPI002B2264AE|nr:glycosyltransferase [Subtercola sp. RTI3]MEA9985872.1 glycosyltransferase [Subtercola sp. RTI3]
MSSEPAAETAHAPIALPGNAWNLLEGVWPATAPTVSVVVVHYRQQNELDRTLAALARQTHPADRTQIIVVDDGSPEPPSVPEGVLVLCQADAGFRASAARNLGAASATGDVLCFLDADTAPEPDYLRAITRLPGLAPDVVTVGARRHADFTGLPPGAPVEEVAPARELPAPAWLIDEYVRSANLLHSDDRSYRFVIGAVVCCSRSLFTTVGGFDESFTSYGGEDWEWAHRAWSEGALFAHVPDAIAWHDGPEWVARTADLDERQRAKNLETLSLATRIPVAGAVPFALRLGAQAPAVEVRIAAADSLAALLIAVDSLLTALPLATVAVPAEFFDSLAPDARISLLPTPLSRPSPAQLVVELPLPVRFDADELRASVLRVTTKQLGSLSLTVSEVAGEVAGVSERVAGPVLEHVSESDSPQPVALITLQRAARREGRWGRTDLFARESTSIRARIISGEPSLAAYFGGWEPEELRP